jgi:NAD(P)-dependent dehydrogenase (short-subunit alcohol dehydrogenase family)
MTWADLSGQVALVTGGTRGIGLAISKALAARGARVIATYRWDEDSAQLAEREISESGAAGGIAFEADASNLEDTKSVLESIARAEGRLDIFISNVAVAARGGDLEKLNRRDFSRSLGLSTWPLVDHVEAIRERFERLPRYIIATSSDGPDHFYPGYDYVAVAKAALEGLALDLARTTSGTSTRVNVIRARQTWTESLFAVFDARSLELLRSRFDAYSIRAEDVANLVVALTSGLLDGVHGQILTLDHGSAFMDNLMSIMALLGEVGS